MATQKFVRSAQVTLDADGAGSATVTPPGGYEWTTNIITLRVSPFTMSSDPQPLAELDIDGTVTEGTYSGQRDSTNTSHHVAAGSTLTCTWTGGPVGAVATLVVRGDQQRL